MVIALPCQKFTFHLNKILVEGNVFLRLLTKDNGGEWYEKKLDKHVNDTTYFKTTSRFVTALLDVRSLVTPVRRVDSKYIFESIKL